MSGSALYSGNFSQPKNLVEFRAGKMTQRGNMVHPDKRKGLVYVFQGTDSLTHLCWKDRTSGAVEDDLIIFPDDAEFKPVPQCTTGRAFVLKFKSSSRKCFFWMQEPKTDKDEEYCKQVNNSINNPPAPGRSDGMGGLPAELASDLGNEDLQSLLSNMSQQQLIELFGGMRSSSPFSNLQALIGQAGGLAGLSDSSSPIGRSDTSHSNAVDSDHNSSSGQPTTMGNNISESQTTTATSIDSNTQPQGSQSQIQLQDLQSILSGLSGGPATSTAAATVSGSQGPAVDLSPAINADVLKPILSNTEFVKKLEEYLPQLGELDQEASSGKPSSNIQSTVQSAHFQQALSMFSSALASGQLGPLVQHFGLGEEAVNAASKGDMEAFVRALQAKEAAEGSPKDATKADSGMAKDKGKEMDDNELD